MRESRRKDKYREYAADFKNEDDLFEELEEEGLDMVEVEKEHFEDDL